MRNGYVYCDGGTLCKISSYIFKSSWYSVYNSRSDYSIQADFFVRKLKKIYINSIKVLFFLTFDFFQSLRFVIFHSHVNPYPILLDANQFKS